MAERLRWGVLGALAIVNSRRFESMQRDYHDTIDVMWGASRRRQ
jgi:hypothetical protein